MCLRTQHTTIKRWFAVCAFSFVRNFVLHTEPLRKWKTQWHEARGDLFSIYFILYNFVFLIATNYIHFNYVKPKAMFVCDHQLFNRHKATWYVCRCRDDTIQWKEQKKNLRQPIVEGMNQSKMKLWKPRNVCRIFGMKRWKHTFQVSVCIRNLLFFVLYFIGSFDGWDSIGKQPEKMSIVLFNSSYLHRIQICSFNSMRTCSIRNL